MQRHGTERRHGDGEESDFCNPGDLFGLAWPVPAQPLRLVSTTIHHG